MSSIYLSHLHANRASPEGEREMGNFKANLFCSFPASVNVSPIASGHNQKGLPSPSKST